ncbi:MAG: STAS domain-containing protein [Ignavibacteriales bacterium]|nr:STAS domain-containing protein [Ignavibacteriales bacterium]MCF8307223.1 STAS domain-containing protein [Ignavibacteriales bacterium]MCF8316867.1 STAS domain-containing protein [Ignavibacteriales bacterium]MCF8438428.1 STAS domain-containing protein [Ignavibacteriales bacterium]
MKTKVVEHYGAVSVELKGNVMGGPEAQEFNKLLHDLLEKGQRNVVIDLSGVKFMNSSGLGMLISGFTTMKNGGGHLKLARATEKINSLLIITKLITIFEHYESVDAAVESFKAAE